VQKGDIQGQGQGLKIIYLFIYLIQTTRVHMPTHIKYTQEAQ